LLDFLNNETPSAGDNITTPIPADQKALSSFGVTVLPATKALKSFKGLDEGGPLSVAALKNGAVQVVELFSSDRNVRLTHSLPIGEQRSLRFRVRRSTPPRALAPRRPAH
jgi:hypothetical protein